MADSRTGGEKYNKRLESLFVPENKDMFKNDGACQKDTGNFVSQIWDQKNVLKPIE